MKVLSAGILLFDRHSPPLRVLLVHPGGPYWAKKDLGAWSIPKGEYTPDEAPETAARREMAEETGFAFGGPLFPLGEARQPSGKQITAFAAEGAFDIRTLRSQSFGMEWPPHSGRIQAFPEVDRCDWFELPEARRRILPGQAVFLDRLDTWLREQT